jgi:hypothetical protein
MRLFSFLKSEPRVAQGPLHGAAIVMTLGGPGVGKTTLTEAIVHLWQVSAALVSAPRARDESTEDRDYALSTTRYEPWWLNVQFRRGPMPVILGDIPGEFVRDEPIPDAPVVLNRVSRPAEQPDPAEDDPAEHGEPAPGTETLAALLERGARGVLVCLDPRALEVRKPGGKTRSDDFERTLGHLSVALANPVSAEMQTYLVITKSDELGLPADRLGRAIRTSTARRANNRYLAATGATREQRWAEFVDAVDGGNDPGARTIRDVLNRVRPFFDLGRTPDRLPPELYFVAARPPKVDGSRTAESAGLHDLLHDVAQHIELTRRPNGLRVGATAGAVLVSAAVCFAGWTADAQGRDIEKFRAATATNRAGDTPLSEWSYSADQLGAARLGERVGRPGCDSIARGLVLKQFVKWERATATNMRAATDRLKDATSARERTAIANELATTLRGRRAALENPGTVTPRESDALDKETGDALCLQIRGELFAAVDALERAARLAAAAEDGGAAGVAALAQALLPLDSTVRAKSLADASRAWVRATAAGVVAAAPIAVANFLRRSGPEVEAFAGAAGIGSDPYAFAHQTADARTFDRPVFVRWSKLPVLNAKLHLRDREHPDTVYVLDLLARQLHVVHPPLENPAVSERGSHLRDAQLELIPGRLSVIGFSVGADRNAGMTDAQLAFVRGNATSTKVWLPAVAAAVRARATGTEPTLRLHLPPGTAADAARLFAAIAPVDPFATEGKK